MTFRRENASGSIHRLVCALALAAAPLAQAQTGESIAEIRARVVRASVSSEDTCPTRVDPAIREYLFLFEGGGDYAPMRFIFRTPDLRTEKSRAETLFDGNGFVWWSPQPARDASGRIATPADWSEDRASLYRIFQEKEVEDDGNGSLLSLLEYARYYDQAYPKRVLYYHYLSVNAAADCAESLKKLHDAAKRPLTFSAVGFSLGGYATVRFARKLDDRDLRLKNVLTIDPVPYTHEAFRALDGRRNGTVIEVPGNHDHWYNLYQRLDDGTLDTWFGLFPIRGAKLSNGVKNRIPIERSGAEVSSHMGMYRSDVAIAELRRILAQ